MKIIIATLIAMAFVGFASAMEGPASSNHVFESKGSKGGSGGDGDCTCCEIYQLITDLFSHALDACGAPPSHDGCKGKNCRRLEGEALNETECKSYTD
jgi:hypothetical protein